MTPSPPAASRPSRVLNERTDLPDGLFCNFAVQPSLQKYFASPMGRSSFIDSAVHPTEGRIAIVTDAGLDAMDADAPLTNGADADGEVVWS
jgi:hypothetical protein